MITYVLWWQLGVPCISSSIFKTRRVCLELYIVTVLKHLFSDPGVATCHYSHRWAEHIHQPVASINQVYLDHITHLIKSNTHFRTDLVSGNVIYIMSYVLIFACKSLKPSHSHLLMFKSSLQCQGRNCNVLITRIITTTIINKTN